MQYFMKNSWQCSWNLNRHFSFQQLLSIPNYKLSNFISFLFKSFISFRSMRTHHIMRNLIAAEIRPNKYSTLSTDCFRFSGIKIKSHETLKINWIKMNLPSEIPTGFVLNIILRMSYLPLTMLALISILLFQCSRSLNGLIENACTKRGSIRTHLLPLQGLSGGLGLSACPIDFLSAFVPGDLHKPTIFSLSFFSPHSLFLESLFFSSKL